MILDIFFFSIRRRHTRLQGDWSSDVCSSDLLRAHRIDGSMRRTPAVAARVDEYSPSAIDLVKFLRQVLRIPLHQNRPDTVRKSRSEERRVGKESKSGWCARPG